MAAAVAEPELPQHKSEAYEDRKRKKELTEARQSGKVTYLVEVCGLLLPFLE
jgi:hypothetical protein